jgi:hypothetical protein
VAYPFAKVPLYGVVKQRFEKEFGCKYLKAPGTLVGPDGKEHAVYYFERTLKDKTLRASAPDLSDKEYVLWSVLRSLCARLDIDPAAFGLDLG